MSIGATSEEILSQTLQGLAMGVQVRHIATAPLCFCSASDQVGAVLSAAEFKIYSQIPVRNGDRTCGVLERAHCNLEGTVRQAMKALDDSILVAAGAPLMEYLEMATNSGYRLVVDGGNVNAIVTRSDLQKLPVRVVVFTLITNLELLMADVIRSLKLVPPGWKQHLSDGRREKVKEKFDKLRTNRASVRNLIVESN
jgi:predicted transcriptional regulator